MNASTDDYARMRELRRKKTEEETKGFENELKVIYFQRPFLLRSPTSTNMFSAIRDVKSCERKEGTKTE